METQHYNLLILFLWEACRREILPLTGNCTYSNRILHNLYVDFFCFKEYINALFTSVYRVFSCYNMKYSTRLQKKKIKPRDPSASNSNFTEWRLCLLIIVGQKRGLVDDGIFGWGEWHWVGSRMKHQNAEYSCIICGSLWVDGYIWWKENDFVLVKVMVVL